LGGGEYYSCFPNGARGANEERVGQRNVRECVGFRGQAAQAAQTQKMRTSSALDPKLMVNKVCRSPPAFTEKVSAIATLSGILI
jgi:hypothetical protein